MLNLKKVLKTAFIKITAKLKDIRILFSSLRWNFFFFILSKYTHYIYYRNFVFPFEEFIKYL